MKSILLFAFLKGLSLLPLTSIRLIGRLTGRLGLLLPSRMKATTETNLELCYPKLAADAHKKLRDSSIINTFQTATEGSAAWLWPLPKVLDHVLEVDGLELLQEAKKQGKGVVVLAPHLGNWEVFGLYLNNCECGSSSQLYQAPRDKRLDRIIYKARSRGGATMVDTTNKGVAMLLKALKRGDIVGILPDQVPNEAGGVYAPFFGRQALTMSLVSRLIQKTGARAVLGYARREKIGCRHGWKILFRPVSEKVYAEHIIDSVTALNTVVEHAVNECPEQYQWEYKRFRRVPEGELRPY